MEETFSVELCSALDWVRDAVTNKHICKITSWHPYKKFLVVDGLEIEMLDDVDCGQDWWDIQVMLNFHSQSILSYWFQDSITAPGIHIPLIIYADSTNISTFKNRSFHPIIGRLGIVPASVRNSIKVGSGTLLGYIPKVKYFKNSVALTHGLIKIHTPSQERKNKEFIDFKREVYHAIFSAIFLELRATSNIGEAIICGDGVERVIYPGVYMLSSDFEEQ